MEKITTLKDLLIQQAKELYDAEKQQQHMLPGMRDKASSKELKKIIGKHIDESKSHVNRLEKVFVKLNERPTGIKSEAMEALLKGGNNLIKKSTDPEVLDAGLTQCVQQINHYKMANYGTASSFAETLGHNDAAKLLRESVQTERDIDKELSKLAKEHLNAKAKAPIAVA